MARGTGTVLMGQKRGWLVAALWFIAGCNPPFDPNLEIAAHEKARKRANFTPFPQATAIKLVASKRDGLSIDATGKPSSDATSKVGIELNANEIAIVQSSFTWSTPPMVLDACCIPRHAFTFHDKNGGFLGSIAVCFECSCAQSNGLVAPTGMNWIEWDEAALRALVIARGMKTVPD